MDCQATLWKYRVTKFTRVLTLGKVFAAPGLGSLFGNWELQTLPNNPATLKHPLKHILFDGV